MGFKPFKFELGQEVEDVITGYTGHVTGQVRHITGCDTFFVQRRYKKGEKIDDSQHIDEPRLKATGKKLKLEIPKEEVRQPGYDRSIRPGK